METTSNTMTAAEFLDSLAPALSLRGEGRASLDTVIATIRADINRAIKVGALPAGTKCSVRQPHYGSLRVEIVAWQGPVFTDAYTEHLLDPSGTSSPRVRGRDYFAEALSAAIDLCERIADRHNYNDSRSEEDYFNVGYYLHVDADTVEAAAMRGIELERDPDLAELRLKAERAAVALGKACTKSVLGRGGFATACKWSLERLVKVADRAAGRPVSYDKRRRAWLPVAA